MPLDKTLEIWLRGKYPGWKSGTKQWHMWIFLEHSLGNSTRVSYTGSWDGLEQLQFCKTEGGGGFRNFQIILISAQVSINMALVFFVQVAANLNLMGKVKSKETIRTPILHPYVIPYIIYRYINLEMLLFA